jgi:hypothetical protein
MTVVGREGSRTSAMCRRRGLKNFWGAAYIPHPLKYPKEEEKLSFLNIKIITRVCMYLHDPLH